MALSRYVLLNNVTLPAGTPATVVAGEGMTQNLFGSAPTTGGPPWPVPYLAGTPIILDPAGETYALIGSANLRAWVDGTDDVGNQVGVSN
jgi:hypothetical protein